jgi:hypothetical protein
MWNSLGCKHGIGVDYNLFLFFNKLHPSGFESEIADFNTLLDYYSPTSSPTRLIYLLQDARE